MLVDERRARFRRCSLASALWALLGTFSALAWAQPAAPPLMADTPTAGTFAHGDRPLEAVVPGNEGDQTFADVFSFFGSSGQTVAISVEGSVEVYLAVLDPEGQLLAGAGTQGDETNPRLEVELAATGNHQVVVNSFHGNVGTYTVTLHYGSAPEPGPGPGPGPGPEPQLTTRIRLSLPQTVAGEWVEGDQPLEALIAEQAGDTTWADAYVVELEEGQSLTVQVSSVVPNYLAILASDGSLLRGDGIEGEDTETEIVYNAVATGDYTLVVNSYHGAPGSYSLTVHESTEDEIQAVSDSMPVDAILEDGVAVSDRIDLSDRIYRTFVVDVPADATALTIETMSEYDIDVFIRQGIQILQNYNTEPDFTLNGPLGNESLRITTVTDPPLREGRYYIDVAALVPVEQRERMAPIPFDIRAGLERTSIPMVVEHVIEDTEGRIVGLFGPNLREGERLTARIDPAEGPLQIWSLNVPPEADFVEVGIFDAAGEMDLAIVPPGGSMPDSLVGFLDVPIHSFSARENERIRIDAESSPPLQEGTYLVVALLLWSEVSADYEITYTMNRPLPPEPTWEPPSEEVLASLDPLQRAIRGTVQLSLSAQDGAIGRGSGTILTPDGLILTNHHVIGECQPSQRHLFGCEGEVHTRPDGQPIDVYIGMSDESHSTSQQAFIARPIRSLPDHDLALLQIVSDLDGNPVDVALPNLPLAPTLQATRIGDEVSVIGYPGVAGIGSRISLSVTFGRITGFTDDRGQRVLVNVDADIGGGNSGGALVNADGVLVGIPSNSFVIFDRGEKQDFARSLNLLPAEWLELLAAHGADIR